MPVLDFPSSPVNGQIYGAYVYSATTASWLGPGNQSALATTTASVDVKETSLESRYTAIETTNATTNRAGLVTVVPTGVSAASGTISYNSTTGLITLVNATDFQIRGIFTSTYLNYRVRFTMQNTAGINFVTNEWFGRFLNGTGPNTSAVYGYASFYVQGASTGVGRYTTGETATRFELSYGKDIVLDINGPYLSDRTTECKYDSAYGHTRFIGEMTFGANTSIDGINLYNNTYTGTVQVFGYR